MHIDLWHGLAYCFGIRNYNDWLARTTYRRGDLQSMLAARSHMCDMLAIMRIDAHKSGTTQETRRDIAAALRFITERLRICRICIQHERKRAR